MDWDLQLHTFTPFDIKPQNVIQRLLYIIKQYK